MTQAWTGCRRIRGRPPRVLPATTRTSRAHRPSCQRRARPPSSSTRFFDLDPNSSCTDESIGLGAPLTAGGCGITGVDVGNISSSSLEEDLLRTFTTDDGVVQLDNSALGMLSSKFDEEYGMFTNGDDLFFGNS